MSHAEKALHESKRHLAVSGKIRRGKRGFSAMANGICMYASQNSNFVQLRSSRTAQIRSCSCFLVLVLLVVVVVVLVLALAVLAAHRMLYFVRP